MQDSLGGQHFALAAEAAVVLLLGSGRLHHRAHPRFTTLVGEQHSNQRFAIDPVGLHPPAPARCGNRGRIDNVAFNSFILQHPINPETIESSLLDDDEREDPSRPCPRLLLELRKALKQPGHIAATYSILRHLFSAARRQRGDQPTGSAQFQRDEDSAKVGADGTQCFGSVDCSLHGRLQGGCGGSNLTLPDSRSLSTTRHGISKRSMCRPIRTWNRGRLTRMGEMSDEYAHLLHRGSGGSMYTRKAYA